MWLSMEKQQNQRLLKWALYLGQFNYTLEHVAGCENAFADFLSRSDEKDKPRSRNREGNKEKVDEKAKTEAECTAVMRAMTRQMIEPETQETFIDPPPLMQKEKDQIPVEAKRESELFSLNLSAVQSFEDGKAPDAETTVATDEQSKLFNLWSNKTEQILLNGLQRINNQNP
uniref:Reverse transcriptase RNase H-like domain-containing protein n=1 Tax=Romanomermis culicivorax TaxID=13658 RepID=A0A915J1R9_ROMCU